MMRFENMILIGGTGRNTGKTTLAERIIEKLSKKVPVTAIKIANIKPENKQFHGHDVSGFTDRIFVEKEIRMDDNKDSMRFLKAGAQASWFIQTEDAFLPETFPEIQKILNDSQWIVCESNSLRKFVKPGLFIMIKGENDTLAKKDVPALLQLADVTLPANEWERFDEVIKKIEIKGGEFVLMKHHVKI